MFNPLNAELNPICHFLALLGPHHILRVSRIRVNKIFQMEHYQMCCRIALTCRFKICLRSGIIFMDWHFVSSRVFYLSN